MVTMKAQEYSALLQDFDPKKEAHRKAFEKITYRFPYFQSAYAHYLKALKEQGQYNYNMILRKTAVLSPSREVLHSWLEQKDTLEKREENTAEQKENKTEQALEVIHQKPPKQKKKTKGSTANSKTKKTSLKPTSKKATVTQETLNMPFNDWVVYSAKGKIKKVEPSFDREDKNTLIDRFLANQPKILPVSQDQPKVDLSANNAFNKEELMTETLAKVYVQQKKYKKALYAYEILSLKYPEKNSLFADQIKTIKQLQQNN